MQERNYIDAHINVNCSSC